MVDESVASATGIPNPTSRAGFHLALNRSHFAAKRSVDRYTLSADQKTLTQARTLSLGGQEATQTIVMVKQ